MRRTLLNVGLIALGVAVFVISITTGPRNSVSETEAFSVPGLDPLTIEEAREDFYRVVPALLTQIYDAFAQTDEDAIYDTLATVTHGDTLEYLYLERAGALAQGGLDAGDQTIHEINLVRARTRRDGGTLLVNAAWQVIGTVGHAEHLHVRGNTYNADLVLAPIDGAWRVTGFDLVEVNRDAAGETFLAPKEDTPEGSGIPDAEPSDGGSLEAEAEGSP